MDEVIMTDAKTRKTERQIIGPLDVFNKSNVSIKAFCEAHTITTSCFHCWKKKYHRDADVNNIKAGFYTLQVSTSATLFAEVGCKKVYQPVSAAYLKELLS